VNFHQEKGNWRSENEDATHLFGLLAIGFASLSSGFAGVYNEKIIKNGVQPLLLIRSLQLSKFIFCFIFFFKFQVHLSAFSYSAICASGLFSVFFALMGVVLKDGALVISQGFFHGYTPFVWLIAAMQVIYNTILK
jgi:UDP-sugar transporter A1/2/3